MIKQTKQIKNLIKQFIKESLALVLSLTVAVLSLAYFGSELINHMKAKEAEKMHQAQIVLRYEKEKACIIEALYYESRSEGINGITAVASVLYNRKNSNLYPGTYCKVVQQYKQFSYTLENKALGKALEASLPASEEQVYSYIVHTSNSMLNGTFKPSLIPSVMWYHALSANPVWISSKSRVKKIGKHIFYRSKGKDKK